MRRDDIEHALDALASEAPAPTADAASVMARGRRRVVRQRALILGVAAVVIAAAAGVGAVARDQRHSAVSTPTPTTSTTPTTNPRGETTVPIPTQPPYIDAKRYDPPPIAIASANESWTCGEPFEFSADGGRNWREVRMPHTYGTPVGEYVQPTLCTAAPGAAWLLRPTGIKGQLEVVRIRDGGAHVEVFPFTNLTSAATIESITFVDANVGWALAEPGVGDPTTTQLYATQDGGKTWALRNAHAPLTLDPQGLPAPGLLAFVNADVGWALGAGPELETTADGGRTWRGVAVPALRAAGGFPTFLNGVFATGNTVVAWGGTAQPGGNSYKVFFDVSADAGRRWALRSGPANLELPLTLQSAFAAGDAEHWVIATDNRLYATDDGGRTWTLRAQFAGLKRIRYVAVGGANVEYASGYGDLPTPSSVVLRTTDGGASWTTVDSYAPPQRHYSSAPTPGGIVGCPTRPLTPAPPGDPPSGLEAAAIENIRTVRQYDPTVARVYRVGASPAGSFASVFTFNVGSCGKTVVDNSWVVELYGPSGQGGGGSTAQAQVVLAHYADGWHVFGRYH